jgi:hypothetical protein
MKTNRFLDTNHVHGMELFRMFVECGAETFQAFSTRFVIDKTSYL